MYLKLFSGLYKLCLLVSHCLFWTYGPCWLPTDQCDQVKNIASILLSIELLCRSLPICHIDVSVSPGSVHLVVKVCNTTMNVCSHL